jgi:hypothetical protein
LIRLRSALGRLRYFAFDSASLVPRCGCQPAKAFGILFGRQAGDLPFASRATDQFSI